MYVPWRICAYCAECATIYVPWHCDNMWKHSTHTATHTRINAFYVCGIRTCQSGYATGHHPSICLAWHTDTEQVLWRSRCLHECMLLAMTHSYVWYDTLIKNRFSDVHSVYTCQCGYVTGHRLPRHARLLPPRLLPCIYGTHIYIYIYTHIHTYVYI